MYALHPLCRIIKGLRTTKQVASCRGMLNHTMQVSVQLEESKSKKPSCLVSLTLKFKFKFRMKYVHDIFKSPIIAFVLSLSIVR